MAVRDDFTAGEVLAAADLNDTFSSKLPYSYGTATPSTTDSGFLWYDSNSTPAAPKFWDGSAFQALTSGKILQVVRATDSTQRTTTSTTLVDVTGMTVTITPQKSDSAVLLIAAFVCTNVNGADNQMMGNFTISDSSNNAISGQESGRFGFRDMTRAATASNEGSLTLIAYATPATTSAVTYKLRMKSESANNSVRVQNATSTGQMFAIEVSA